MTSDEKNVSLNNAVSQIEREHGKGAIMRLTDTDVVPVESIRQGLFS